MDSLVNQARNKAKQTRSLREAFRNEDAAIDLASIMVGIIVIGLIGGVIAATVFAVIPWTQDNAAKHQLESIVQAENAYFGLSAAVPSPLPNGSPTNSFADSEALNSASLLSPGKTYCAVVTDGGKGFQGFSQSASGKIWEVTDKNTKPEIFSGSITGSSPDALPADCMFITEGFTDGGAVNPSEPEVEVPYVDPTPTQTRMTYKCDVTTSSVGLPFSAAKVTWNDGITSASRNMTAGVEYTVVAEGGYSTFSYYSNPTDAKCLRSVDHWGSETGVTSAAYAFTGASNLTNVPENIPTTITGMYSMFNGASSFNDPDVAKWNVSKVTDMRYMFVRADSFNQPLNNWDVSKVTNMTSMFYEAASFNQPLNNWDVSNVTDMIQMFKGTTEFNQDLSAWDTSSVTSMAYMFGDAFTMKNGVNHNTFNKTTTLTYKCDVTTGNVSVPFNVAKATWNDGIISSARSMIAGVEYTVVAEGGYSAFSYYNNPAYAKCLRSVDHWGSATGVTTANHAFAGASNLTNVPENIPTTLTGMYGMFNGATSFNDPDVAKWNVSKVTDMRYMFLRADSFNQPLNSWDVSKVTNMTIMFYEAASFNQPLNNWNVSNVTDMIQMFKGATDFNQDLSSWDTSSVTSMAYMFGDAFTMKNGVNHNTFNKTTTLTYKCDVTTGSVDVPFSVAKVTWNDGITSASRNMAAGVEYTVVAEGTYASFTYQSRLEDAKCLRSVDHWGTTTGVTSAAYAFAGATNLTNVPESIPTSITNMYSMFNGATSFNDIDVAKWNVSKVTDMRNMFVRATSFNQPLNSWDVSKVTLMTYMFYEAASFNQPLNSWNVSSVTDMIQMFKGATNFAQDLSSWDTSSVTSMAYMFGDAFAMKNGVKHNTFNKTTTLTYKCDVTTSSVGLPISTARITWNDGITSASRNMAAGVEYTVVAEGGYASFSYYSNPTDAKCLRSVDHWGSATGVTSAAHAFTGASNLTNVPENIPTTITGMYSMFNGASSFNDPDVAQWNVSNVTDMRYMFNGATGFNQNLSGWNTAALTSGTTFAPASFPDAFMPAKTSK